MYTQRDARWLSETTLAIYAATSSQELAQHAIQAVYGHFRCMIAACEQVSHDGADYILHGIRSEVAIPQDYTAYIHDHPIFPLLKRRPVPTDIQLSEVMTRRAWELTDHFNGIARPTGFNDQIVVASYSATDLFDIAIFRDVVFSAEELALMQFLQRHLRAAWSRLSETDRASSYQTRVTRLFLSPGLRPLEMLGSQREQLATYFGRRSWSQGLPARVGEWVRDSLRRLATAPSGMLYSLKSASARGQLVLRLYPAHKGGGVMLQLVETPAAPNFFRLGRNGLSSRECEVLYWVAGGKRDAEIAIILGCSPATVGKHVENLLRKMGVRTRLACVHEAYRILRRGGGATASVYGTS